MNIKTLWLVPGVLVLTLSSLPMLPIAAQPAPAEMQRGMNKLNLTDTQKADMKRLREETQAQIEQILNPEQKAQLQSIKQSGRKMRGEIKSLNLSETQKQQMRQIKERSKQKMLSILTPEQRELMQQQRPRMKRFQQRG